MTKSAISVAVAALALVGCSQSRTRTDTSTISRPPAIRVSGAPGEIPAGTTLEVRTNEVINSKSAGGRTYSAEIATEVVGADGRTLMPRGSTAELLVIEARDREGILKGPSVQLGLRSVTINGATYMVVSRELEQSGGIGANRRTGEMVGGGAALGTVIGAAAGGGKGAVIGGLAGAAAGAAVQILTQGNEVRIPAESVLKFRLDESLRLQQVP